MLEKRVGRATWSAEGQHRPTRHVAEPIVDLFAAETASLLASTDYIVGDRLAKVSPLIPSAFASKSIVAPSRRALRARISAGGALAGTRQRSGNRDG